MALLIPTDDFYFFSGIHFHRLLSEFRKSNENPPYYVVICDIKDAFGSIDHAKMVDILGELSRKIQDTFYVHKLQFRKSHETKPFVRKVLSLNNKMETIPDNLAHFTFLQHCGCRKMDSKSELKMVAKRLKLHTLQLKIGSKKRNYLVTKGIVQGES